MHALFLKSTCYQAHLTAFTHGFSKSMCFRTSCIQNMHINIDKTTGMYNDKLLMTVSFPWEYQCWWSLVLPRDPLPRLWLETEEGPLPHSAHLIKQINKYDTGNQLNNLVAFAAVLRIWIRDPGSGAFITLESGIGEVRIRIRDE